MLERFLSDSLMFYVQIIRFLWIEDIISLYSVSSRFYSVMISLEGKIRVDVDGRTLIEDYEDRFELVKSVVSKRKDVIIFGWKRFNIVLKSVENGGYRKRAIGLT